ncbi:unnamed protein product [Calypogeia fissa]
MAAAYINNIFLTHIFMVPREVFLVLFKFALLEREKSPSVIGNNFLRIMAGIAEPPVLEPTGERCEVPVAQPSVLKKEAEQHQTDANDVAEAQKETEHQYVFSEKKLDGSEVKHDHVAKQESPPTEAKT